MNVVLKFLIEYSIEFNFVLKFLIEYFIEFPLGYLIELKFVLVARPDSS